MVPYPKWKDKVRMIKEAVRDGTASDAMLRDVVHDLEIHLAAETSTLDNYCGVFGKETISHMRKNFPHCVNWDELDEIKEKKKQAIMNAIVERFLHNDHIPMSPQYVHMVLDYLDGKSNEDPTLDKVVIVGYPTADSGKITNPLPKRKRGRPPK